MWCVPHGRERVVATTRPRLTVEVMVHPVFWTEPWAYGDSAIQRPRGSRASGARVVDGSPYPAAARPARLARMVPVTATEGSEPDHEPAASAVSTDSRVAPGTSATEESTVRAQPGGPEPQSGPELPQPAASVALGDEGAAQPEWERWREALRELEAAKERALREGERARQEARAELVSRLFPVLDGLDRSLASGAATNGLMEGVRLVREQLAQVLSDFGVDRIDAVGRPFDPKEHEAVDIVGVDTPSDHHRVVEQWEAGYRYAGRVLRPARVRVGKFGG